MNSSGFYLFLVIMNLAAVPSCLIRFLKTRTWLPTIATVEKVERKPLGDDFYWVPLVRYVLDDKSYAHNYQGPSIGYEYKVGQKFHILVDPKAPADILICSRLSLVLPMVAILILDAFSAVNWIIQRF